MAWQLVSEVLNHAPPDLTPTERLLIVVIADYVHQDDYQRGVRRTCRLHGEIGRRVGISEHGVRKTLQRLAHPEPYSPHAGRAPIELRVAHGKDKNGCPRWVMPGRKPEFRVPVFAPPASCDCGPCRRLGLSDGGPKVGDDGPNVGDGGPHAGDEAPEHGDHSRALPGVPGVPG